MTFAAICSGQFRCDPRPASDYAKELRKLGKAAGEVEGGYAIGFNLDRRQFEGEAGDSFRARCTSRMATAAELSDNMAALSEAADELSFDAADIEILLDEIIDIAHGGGLVVSGGVIHPPNDEVRVEDTPALVQGWQAWDKITIRHHDVETKVQRTLDDWIQAIGRYGYSTWAQRSCPQGPWVPDTGHEKGVGGPEDPPRTDPVPPGDRPFPGGPGGSTGAGAPSGSGGGAPEDTGSTAAAGSGGASDGSPDGSPDGRPDGMGGGRRGSRFDEDSAAQWIGGHRDKGQWVAAHWQPVGQHGHGTFAVAATWVEAARNDDGEWVLGHWNEVGGSPHAAEHPSGATMARWVDGRWQPVAPDTPPSIALSEPAQRRTLR